MSPQGSRRCDRASERLLSRPRYKRLDASAEWPVATISLAHVPSFTVGVRSISPRYFRLNPDRQGGDRTVTLPCDRPLDAFHRLVPLLDAFLGTGPRSWIGSSCSGEDHFGERPHENSDLLGWRTPLPTGRCRRRFWLRRISGGHFRSDTRRIRTSCRLGWWSFPGRRVRLEGREQNAVTDAVAESTQAIELQLRPPKTNSQAEGATKRWTFHPESLASDLTHNSCVFDKLPLSKRRTT